MNPWVGYSVIAVMVLAILTVLAIHLKFIRKPSVRLKPQGKRRGKRRFLGGR